eukprot:4283151-Heterocapsa_arctica.AAC.1
MASTRHVVKVALVSLESVLLVLLVHDMHDETQMRDQGDVLKSWCMGAVQSSNWEGELCRLDDELLCLCI